MSEPRSRVRVIWGWLRHLKKSLEDTPGTIGLVRLNPPLRSQEMMAQTTLCALMRGFQLLGYPEVCPHGHNSSLPSESPCEESLVFSVMTRTLPDLKLAVTGLPGQRQLRLSVGSQACYQEPQPLSCLAAFINPTMCKGSTTRGRCAGGPSTPRMSLP